MMRAVGERDLTRETRSVMPSHQKPRELILPGASPMPTLAAGPSRPLSPATSTYRLGPMAPVRAPSAWRGAMSREEGGEGRGAGGWALSSSYAFSQSSVARNDGGVRAHRHPEPVGSVRQHLVLVVHTQLGGERRESRAAAARSATVRGSAYLASARSLARRRWRLAGSDDMATPVLPGIESFSESATRARSGRLTRVRP